MPDSETRLFVLLVVLVAAGAGRGGWVEDAELDLVVALSAFAVASRRLLGHCIFSHARGERDSLADAKYDLLYAVPLVVATWHRVRRQSP